MTGAIPDLYDPVRIHRRNIEFFRRLNPDYVISAEPAPGIEELIVRDLDMDLITQVRQTWQFYRDRRPEAYGDLCRP